ncbi:sensor histidine kinase [Actinoplanes sp. CA-030573]|uniref:sensor histidine kinase n=1 Tax=Actinoplanes sp. CA-030573 TaxID=3239898 RepID=UPI003D92BA98
MYTARLSRRWRVIFTVASVAASAPVLAVAPGTIKVLAAALIVVQAAAVWWLDERPALGTAVVLLVSGAFQLMVPSFGPGIAFVVLCTYAWLRPAGETLWILGLAVLTVCGPPLADQRWVAAALWLGAVLLAWSWGALVRARGERRVAERRQAVLEERARIARDLHDILSHTVSVMVVQAAAADDVFESNPARAREALRRTEEAGRQALAELRGFLRTVRAENEDDAAPQPTLADVDRLAASMNESGLRVTVRREGAWGEVPLGVQVGAYRIVQEALTNTLRHARASTAEVLVRIDEAEVRVRVRDDGRGGDGRSSGAGHGLAGMRERAELLGGALAAGPRADGVGFEVDAHLPVRAES